MVLWLKAWGSHVLSLWIACFAFVVHGEEFLEKIQKFAGLKKWIVRRIDERRKLKMTFLEMLTKGPEVLQVIINILAKAGSDLPLILKTMQDFQALAADEKNPAKLMADLETIAPDITADLNALVGLFPASATTTTTTTTTPAA